MNTFKLEIFYDGSGREMYHAYVNSISVDDNQKIAITKTEEKTTLSQNEAALFLKDKGVLLSEAKFALEHMRNQGHNSGSFGVMGTFLHSEYKGKAS